MFSSSPSSVRQALKALGARLRELRINAQLTGRELASLAQWHSSKVSRIEHGKQAPSLADIEAWCMHCGAPEIAVDLTNSLHAVEGMFIEWQRMEQTGLLAAQESLISLWQRTRNFRVYSSWFIPGAVQTASYTRAILKAIASRRGLPDDVENAVESRMKRLEMLHTGNRRFTVIVEESVLSTAIAPADVMIEQLQQLGEIGSLPSVVLGIIPRGIARDAWPVEDFWLYDDRQANVELVSGWLTVTRPGEIAMYAQAFAELKYLAVFGMQAQEIILRAIQSINCHPNVPAVFEA